MGIKDLVAGALKPISDAYQAHVQKKITEKQVEAKIAQKQIDSDAQVEFNEQEWELLALWSGESTWKDEYVTVSVVLIFNLIVFGGIAAAFGYPQVLNGIVQALDKLKEIGVDVGNLMQVVIYAAVGLYGINKLRSR